MTIEFVLSVMLKTNRICWYNGRAAFENLNEITTKFVCDCRTIILYRRDNNFKSAISEIMLRIRFTSTCEIAFM